VFTIMVRQAVFSRRLRPAAPMRPIVTMPSGARPEGSGTAATVQSSRVGRDIGVAPLLAKSGMNMFALTSEPM
jgi:hypothetical protein